LADQGNMTLVIGGGAARFNWPAIFAAEKVGCSGKTVECGNHLGTVDKEAFLARLAERGVTICWRTPVQT
jgi:hypothetical protein